MKLTYLISALTVLAMLLPSPIAAQLSDMALDREHDEAIATAYGGAPGAIERAVILHGQVVHSRALHDARRFECLKSHANLLYYYGRLEGARLYMEAAAEQAAWAGKPYDAAMAYIDAAILAKKAGDITAARNLADIVVRLSGSPRLEGDERTEILDRLRD